MASVINLTISEDDDATPTFAITDEDGPLNLTSADVVAVIKTSEHVEDNASSGVYTLTEGSGITVTDAAQGQIQIAIPEAVTESPGFWWYKIRVTVGSATRTAITGWITIQDT